MMNKLILRRATKKHAYILSEWRNRAGHQTTPAVTEMDIVVAHQSREEVIYMAYAGKVKVGSVKVVNLKGSTCEIEWWLIDPKYNTDQVNVVLIYELLSRLDIGDRQLIARPRVKQKAYVRALSGMGFELTDGSHDPLEMTLR